MDPLAERLARAGFVAAEEEAEELRARAGDDGELLEALLARRLTGEPLAWITGTAPFCGLWIGVDPGVYVPRWQTEALARRAAELLPDDGVAFDLCTGSGAIAAYLAGPADVITAVVPYVPTPDLPLLQRDTFTFESTLPYDGGPDGTTLLRRVLAEATKRLRGTLLLELGGDQADALRPDLERLGYEGPELIRDEEDDVRGIECRFPGRPFV